MSYAATGALKGELYCLEQQGALEKVTYSEWTTPIVALTKPNGRYRVYIYIYIYIKRLLKK